MGYWEKVHEIMKSDPTRKWTAPEIAMMLKTDMADWEYPAVRGNVLQCLKQAAKYGLVKEDGMAFINCHNSAAKVWVLV